MNVSREKQQISPSDICVCISVYVCLLTHIYMCLSHICVQSVIGSGLDLLNVFVKARDDSLQDESLLVT